MRADILETAGDTACGHSDYLARVSALLFDGFPAAVGRRIRPVIVYTIKHESWWRLPHVSKEDGERMPLLADQNTSPAVVGVSVVVWILASLDHVCPLVIRATHLSAFGMTVCGAPSDSYFGQEASTRTRESSLKGTIGDGSLVSAITEAKTHAVALSARACSWLVPSDHNELSKPSVDERIIGWHNSVLSVVVFSCGKRFEPLAAATVSGE